MPVYEDPVERLNLLLDQQEVRIATIFRTAIDGLKNEIDLNDLANLIEQGRLNEAIDRLQFAAEQLGSASNVAFITSGQSTATFLNAAGVGRVVFNEVSTFAVEAMQRNRLELIREFADEQRRVASTAMITGVEGGANPRAQARNFRDSVGLTENQWKHVASYRAVLERVGSGEGAQMDALNRALRDGRGDAQIKRAIRDSKPLKPEKVDWLVERYSARYVKHRAEVIGRTEALRAVNQGNEESYRQAIASGTIAEDAIERQWRTRLDGRQRDTHALLNGTKRRWGEAWETRHGLIKYPGDPDAAASEVIQCRCALLTRIRQR